MTNVSLLTREILRVLKGPSCFHGPFCPIDHRRGTWPPPNEVGKGWHRRRPEPKGWHDRNTKRSSELPQRQLFPWLAETDALLYSIADDDGTGLGLTRMKWDEWAYGKIILFGGPRLSLCMRCPPRSRTHTMFRRRRSHLFSWLDDDALSSNLVNNFDPLNSDGKRQNV